MGRLHAIRARATFLRLRVTLHVTLSCDQGRVRGGGMYGRVVLKGNAHDK
jgi:hypothetical protein